MKSKPTIGEILAPKPEARPRIYAYSIDDKAHVGLLKVGQTTRDVKQRVAEQLKTADLPSRSKATEIDEPRRPEVYSKVPSCGSTSQVMPFTGPALLPVSSPTKAQSISAASRFRSACSISTSIGHLPRPPRGPSAR